MVVCTSGDIHCGWVGYFGPETNMKSVQMGVNIIVYCLTH
jgi:hypothetical protein